MKAEKVSEQAADAEVDDVVGRRSAALKNEGKDGDLENVGEDGENHGNAQARTGGDFNGSVIEVSGRGHGSHR